MSPNLSFSGNSQFDNDSLKSSCNVVAVVSELNLSILGGIFPEGVAFLGFNVLIYFSISNAIIPTNVKESSFPILFLMSNILGWMSNFLIPLSTGSTIGLDSLLTIYEFLFISKVDITFFKEVFSVSATLSSFCISSLFSFLQLYHHFVLTRHFQ